MVQFLSYLLPLMTDTLTVIPGYTDQYGDFVPSGEQLSLQCRFSGKERLVRTDAGREVLSTLQATVGSYNYLTTHSHRYTVPSKFSPNESLTAIVIKKHDDEDGALFETVMFE